MPRINGVMQTIPNAYGSPGATVESAKYNAQLDDLVADANAKRPVTAGGTGADNAADALTNLGGVAKTAMDEADAKRLLKSGDAMTGPLTSAVKAHGSLGAVTEEYKYGDGNTHSVTVAAGSGTHTINPTGLVEGGSMEINLTYQSGAFAVAGTTEWIVGGGQRSTNFGDIGVTLTAGKTYVIALKMAGATRVGGVV